MLYLYKNDGLEALPYFDYADLKGKEKDLENLLASHLGELYVEEGQLMPIFQERQWQEEPDLCALDKNGNLIIFELKRGKVPGDTTIQVMRYAQSFGRKKYNELNSLYQNYKKTDLNLADAHAEAFELEHPLKEDIFNRRQKLVIVGSSSDIDLIESVEYWKEKGLEIDFLPYRFYKIGEEQYFEFFAKPYDYHVNPKDAKAIIFDTNKSYDPDAIWDMFDKDKISAYGTSTRYIEYFNKGDYALYYHKGFGVVGAGIVSSSISYTDADNDELFRTVNLLTPKISNEEDICCISPSELTSMLDKNFYYASTAKSPYLSVEEAKQVVDELIKRYEHRKNII